MSCWRIKLQFVFIVLLRIIERVVFLHEYELMVAVACPVSGCLFVTDDLDPSVVTVLLQLHATEHSQQNSSTSGPKLRRPSLNAGVSQEVWNAFVRRWDAFKVGSCIGEGAAAVQLFQCASEELADLLLKYNPQVFTCPVDEVLAAMRSLAVVPVARGVVRAELMQMRQMNDESFRLFAARVRGKAETCAFEISEECSCGKQVHANYTEAAIRDVLLAGISDSDIRREALSTKGLQNQDVNNIVSFVEGREMASRAVSHTCRQESTSSLSACSSFKRQSKDRVSRFNGEDKSRPVPCPDCGKPYQLYKRGKRGWNQKPFKNCFECWRAASRNSNINGQDELGPSVTTLCASQISTVETKTKIGHQIFSDGCWHQANFRGHPMLSIQLKAEHSNFEVTVNAYVCFSEHLKFRMKLPVTVVRNSRQIQPNDSLNNGMFAIGYLPHITLSQMGVRK